jgi:hypothetical protein
MRRVMRPALPGRVVVPRGVIARRVVVTGRVDDHHAALRPVEAAEKEPGRDVYPRAPVVSRIAVVVVRGGCPHHGRIRRPPPAAVHDIGIVIGHVHHPGLGGLDDDGLFFAHHLGVFVRGQRPRGIGARAQELDRVHHLRFLVQHRVAEAPRPVEVLIEPGQEIRERHERLDAGIPLTIRDGSDGVLTLEVGILPRPARGFDDFQRIRGGDQDLGQQRIRIQRDRRQHLVELGLAESFLAREDGIDDRFDDVVLGTHGQGHQRHRQQRHRQGWPGTRERDVGHWSAPGFRHDHRLAP